MQPYGYPQFKEPPKWMRFLKHKKLSILLAAVFVTVILITFSNKGLLRRFILESKVSQKQESIQQLRVDIRDLKRRRQLLQTDDFEIEKVAREQHGMIKPGEIVYRIERDGSDN